MRVLVVGAGAVGGYLGGRLLQVGQDVTFLVRPKRAQELAADGLVIYGRDGTVRVGHIKTIQAELLAETFDVVLVSCKSYDLESAISPFEPAVGPMTAIVPMLNGMRHLDILDSRFGVERVFGGVCTIPLGLNERREVIHLQPFQSITIGPRAEFDSDRLKVISGMFAAAAFNGTTSMNIEREMWLKWVFIASMAASTCLMRGSIGSITSSPGGEDFMHRLIEECRATAAAHGHPPSAEFMAERTPLLTAKGSDLTASLLRDMQSGLRIEADSLIGDLVERAASKGVATPLMRLAYTHLKVYERELGRGI